MEEKTKKETNPKYLWIILLTVVFLAGVVLILAKYQKRTMAPSPGTGITKSKDKSSEIKKFASEQEFKDYLEKAKNISGSYLGRGAGGPGLMEMSAEGEGGFKAPMAALPSRVSQTNVQVAGIDEPDTVKTDGKEIYFSIPRPEIMPLDDTVGREDESQELSSLAMTGGTKTIKAFPPDSLKIDAKIEKSGDLLIDGKTLVIIPSERYYWSRNSSKIFGYDISNPEKPKEIWNIELKDSTSIAGVRLAKGKIYLATKTDFRSDNSCLLKPLIVNGSEFSIKCTDIYHPGAIVPSEATYTAMTIDPVKGTVEKSISFVGSSDYASSVVYMPGDSLYLTYYNPGDSARILHAFLSENKDLAPDWLVEKLKKLIDYDISISAKMTEIWELLARFQSAFTGDERLKMQNEMANRISDYLARHRRELDTTGIVKIKADDLNIDSTGTVPGRLLNQFSLDEFKGDLRVATTVGENFLSWGLGFGGGRSNDTANDVYILGDGLKTEGSVIDLGKGERIYAVRFIEDKGYVVTFKQVDPFYVLDLSDPMNPLKKGELKIPGYSSYLHPIAKNRILGIGAENNKVKISLFDVSDPADPTEIAKYNLDEYWSEASNNHHAFLQDAKHEIFFLPGSKGGYIFSYAGDNLKLEKTVSETAVKRAVYINDYLYVIGENNLIVLDERNWERVGEMEL